MASGKTVWIVDDDASPRMGFFRLVVAAGYEVRAFASLGEMFRHLDRSSEGFDCVILDLRMQEPPDTGLRPYLCNRGVSRPLIVTTADDSEEARSKANDLGAVAFFRKPVDGDALLDAVKWAVDASRRESQGADDDNKTGRKEAT
jgi:FixJ family two-component response regulator